MAVPCIYVYFKQCVVAIYSSYYEASKQNWCLLSRSFIRQHAADAAPAGCLLVAGSVSASSYASIVVVDRQLVGLDSTTSS